MIIGKQVRISEESKEKKDDKKRGLIGLATTYIATDPHIYSNGCIIVQFQLQKKL